MRPIRLQIRGINSFVEEQIIDFEQLTGRGLFGIFGPTGSGKSTILDGITLALYGDIARNSANFINTNCEKAYVSFTFQISGAEKRAYEVSREYRLDKNGLAPRSGKCRLMDITTEEYEILADKVTSVNEMCEQIIGLNKHDFMRTVVLPQGKFSEFLKMEGASRRDMLERLFNLYQYGDELKAKLSASMEKEKTALNILLGQEMEVMSVSEEDLQEKKREQAETKKNHQLLEKELRIRKKEYEEKQQIISLQNDLNVHLEKRQEFEKRREDMEAKEAELEIARKVNLVLPHLQARDEAKKTLSLRIARREELEKKKAELEKAKEEIEKQWNIANEEKNEIVPKKRLQLEKIKEAMEEAKSLQDVQKKLDEIENEIRRFNQIIFGLEEDFWKKEDKKRDLEFQVSQGKARLIEIRVETHIKEKAAKGESLQIHEREKQAELESLKQQIFQIQEKLQTQEKSRAEVQKEVEDLRLQLEEKNQELLALESNCPGTQEDVLKLWAAYNDGKVKWEKLHEAEDRISTIHQQWMEKSKEVEELEAEVKRLALSQEELERGIHQRQVEKSAEILREELKEGTPCPVCGSTSHHVDRLTLPEKLEWDKLEAELRILKQSLKNKNDRLVTLSAQMEGLSQEKEAHLDILQKLQIGFPEKSELLLITQYEEMNQAVTEYQNKIKLLGSHITEGNQKLAEKQSEAGSIEVRIQENNQRLKEAAEQLKQRQEQLQKIADTLKPLQKELETEDFITLHSKIQEKDRQREQLDDELRELEEQVQAVMGEIERMKKNLDDSKEKANQMKLQAETLKEREKRSIEIILEKAGTVEDLPARKEILEGEVEHIIKTFQEAEANKVSTIEAYQTVKVDYEKAISLVHELTDRLSGLEKNLAYAMNANGFSATGDVVAAFRDLHQMEQLEREGMEFRSSLERLNGAIEEAQRKLAGRIVSMEEWQTLLAQKEQAEKGLEESIKLEITLEQRIIQITEAFEKRRELGEEKARLEKKIARLKDLETLFKGKKFVEFVATEQLQYIAREASSRLEDITSGTYGLALDENGRFLIRDNKNGGVLREASTLSGGETFLASLALALALSSEIQLTHSAPLELFFLDEGFGTLDENLLDVVMNSLEKIHNDKLRVGIISHVESVKNRVPVKLVVQPAKTGTSGSRVQIEIS